MKIPRFARRLLNMPRSLWNGTIAFGMVRVPVKLYSATESKAVRFRERHAPDGAAIEHRRVCVQEGKEVPYGETVKGFEVSSGSYVTLSKEEIAAADGPGAHMIEIEHFAGREEIDPVYYDRAYRLGPGKLGDDSYLLLHAALKRSDRVGIGRFVFHNKAHLVALRALEDVIALHTMRFADELVPAGDLEMPTPQRKPSKPEVSAARALLDQLSSSFQPQEYEDTYRAALLELIERKARGETIAVAEPEEIAPADDLLGALQASLEGVGRSRTSPAKRKAKRKKSKPKPGESRSGRTVDGSRSPATGARRTGKPAGSGR
jgi:DNA end-binding protein Ku